jgi:hypothetical protein
VSDKIVRSPYSNNSSTSNPYPLVWFDYSSGGPSSSFPLYGEYQVVATVAVQNTSAASLGFNCVLRDRQIAYGSSGFRASGILSSTPPVYQTAMRGRPATATVTGVLLMDSGVGFSSALNDEISLACELSKGTTAHINNFTMTMNKVSSVTRPTASSIRNSFRRSLHHRNLNRQPAGSTDRQAT